MTMIEVLYLESTVHDANLSYWMGDIALSLEERYWCSRLGGHRRRTAPEIRRSKSPSCSILPYRPR